MKQPIILKFILVLYFIPWAVQVNAQEEKYIGLFVYNFTKFFDWPENMKSGNFTIEVLGHESVGDELIRLTSGKSIGNQPIVIKNINSIDQITKCNILFIGHWQSRIINDILTKTNGNNTLIISESEGILDKGTALNFVIRDNSIKFEINLTNAKNRGLKIDPRIRELAYKVVE